MAFDYDNTLRRIISKAELLETRHARLLQSYDEAKTEIESLRADADRKDKEIQQLRMQVEYLQLATTIAPTREQVDATKAIIANLVREIDRCITDLSD